ncbi:hypothetical protein B5X24_HaOG214310 [Helicoverpa armigera]|nr:hypothetical protein B5X24_HaOG214310 [Helicoverpa armigera]
MLRLQSGEAYSCSHTSLTGLYKLSQSIDALNMCNHNHVSCRYRVSSEVLLVFRANTAALSLSYNYNKSTEYKRQVRRVPRLQGQQGEAAGAGVTRLCWPARRQFSLYFEGEANVFPRLIIRGG